MSPLRLAQRDPLIDTSAPLDVTAAADSISQPGLQVIRSDQDIRFLLRNPEQFSQPLEILAAENVGLETVTVSEFIDHYCDTSDARLYRAGWTLRWRNASGAVTAELRRAPGSGGEEERIVQTVHGDAYWHEKSLGPVSDRLRLLASDGRFRELFRTHTYRRLYQLQSPNARIEMSIDQVTITWQTSKKDAVGRRRIDELKLELQQGDLSILLRLAERLKDAFELVPSRLTNFDRGLQTIGSPTFEETDERVGVDELAICLAHRYLGQSFRQLLREEPRAWEALDAEGVHQMRVATRRLRAAFRAFQAILPTRPIQGFNDEFRWLGAVLGKVRDLDVQKENLRLDTVDMPPEDVACLADFRVYLDEEWRKARRQLLSHFEGARYRRLIERFEQFLRRSPANRVAVATPAMTVRQAAVEFIDERLKKVLRCGRLLTADSPLDEYHDLRIQCKRLRYLFEFFTPAYGAALTPFVRRLKQLQELLGKLQDTCVANSQLREYVEHVPALAKNRRLLVSLGQLISGQRVTAGRRREKFHKVWSRFDRKGLRRRVRQVLSGE